MANRRTSAQVKADQKALKEEYRRVRNNLIRNMHRMEKRGFFFPDKFLPQIPKKITAKSIARLEALNKNRYKKATDFTKKKGTGEELKKKQYSERSKKSAKTRKERTNDRSDIYLHNLKEHIMQHEYENEVATKQLIEMLDDYIESNTETKYNAVKHIEENYPDLVEAVDTVMRYREGTPAYSRAMTRFYQLLKPNATAEELVDFYESMGL